jgi:flavin reductase (DIM6/NTAB) family NADH-FMN oxidoreductase RutF
MNFRDAMSLVPSSVSLLATLVDSRIYACTISSLVSVNISSDDPEILFVLKKDSLTGNSIKTSKSFTINLLSHTQRDSADEFSKPRAISVGVDSTKWRLESGTQLELTGSRVFMACELIQVYNDHLADIYIAKVLRYKFNNAHPALIYDERKYGSFHPDSQN